MAEATSSSAAAQARQELILTRIFGAPRSLVFRAWTDPQHMARWWGPPAASPTPSANSTCALAASCASTCADLMALSIQ
jgi:Activator of Hsp90 ATPase homolog 1-like protein